jgi:methionyl-tRNA formyltransferase
VPIQRVATEELQLDTHVTDTFTGWSPPAPFDLVIAVSFGLFVPPRILSHAKYGGLNVHPSLLPDLRGPAPIEHALLQQRKRTGVSIQTLHPVHFDHGTILAQTPAPGLLISSGTTKAALEIQLAKIGAKMLVDVLNSRSYVPPHQDSGWYASMSNASVNYAPKITKQDSFVDFEKHTKEEIMVKQRALGETWCLLPNGDRLIMHHLRHDDGGDTSSGPLGIWTSNNQANPLFRAANGRVGQIRLSTYEGGKVGCGNAKLLRMFPPQKELGDEDEIYRLSSQAADDDGLAKKST